MERFPTLEPGETLPISIKLSSAVFSQIFLVFTGDVNLVFLQRVFDLVLSERSSHRGPTEKTQARGENHPRGNACAWIVSCCEYEYRSLQRVSFPDHHSSVHQTCVKGLTRKQTHKTYMHYVL
jgi:hypothetical protein